MLEDIDCKCTKGTPVDYKWAGDDIHQTEEETLAQAIARWFALKAANLEMTQGALDSRRFNKYLLSMEAFIEQRIVRLQAGKLTPGTEVVVIARAQQKNLPMFEFRWFAPSPQLKSKHKELIRHYDYEPADKTSCVFGVHMHLKKISGSDDEIIDKQNAEIDVAIDIVEKHEFEN